MARNSERAILLLNRWQTMRSTIERGRSERRPVLPDNVTSISECVQWRSQIVRELAHKLAEIQDYSIGETKLLLLNDDILSLTNHRNLWTEKLKLLGGNVTEYPSKLEKDFVITKDGKKYYGACKNIPSIKSNILKFKAENDNLYNKEVFKDVDLDYFGVNETDDEKLLEAEKTFEAKLQEKTRLR